MLHEHPLHGTTGIGHTRWATHGAPTETNAHPHATARVAIVHNGIIENFRELRAELTAKGHKFESQTDSEVAAHLVTANYERGAWCPMKPPRAAVARLTGAYSIAMIFKDHEGLLVGARKGARRWRWAMPTMKPISAPMLLRWRLSPIASPIWKKAMWW